MISIPRNVFTAADARDIAEEAGVRVALTSESHIVLSPAVAADLWESVAEVIETILAIRAEDAEIEREWSRDLDPEIAALYGKLDREALEKTPRAPRSRALPTDEERDNW